MKPIKLSILTFIVFSVHLICNAQFQGKLFNRYFSPIEYKGSTQNWSITSDNNGLIYFGNHEGVLEYDGLNWRKIEIPNKSTVRSLAKSQSGNIIVGAIGEMGYLSPNSIGNLEFISLRPFLDTSKYDFADIWSTQSTKDGDFFLSDNFLYRFHNNKFKIWAKQGAYFYLCFALNDELFLYEVGIGLQKIVNDSIILLPKGDFFADKKIHSLIDYDDKLLVFTRSSGIFVYDKTNSVSPITAFSDISDKAKQINNFFIKNSIYNATKITSKLFAIATLKSGVIIIDNTGEIIDIINNETTGTSSQVYSLLYNQDGNLWLGLDNGIQKIELASPFRYLDKSSGINGSVNNIAVLKDNLYFSSGLGLFVINLKDGINQINISKTIQIDGINEQVTSFLLFNPVKGNNSNCNPYEKSKLIKEQHLKDTTLLVGTSRGLYAILNNKAILLTDYKGALYIYQSEINPSIVYLGMDNGIAYVSYIRGKWYFNGYIGKIVDQIKNICEDNKGNLWIAANYKGIYKLNISNLLNGSNKNLNSNLLEIEFYDKNFGIPNMVDVLIFKVKDKLKFYTKDGFYIFNEKSKYFLNDPSIGKNYVDSTWVNEILNIPEKNIWINANYSSLCRHQNKIFSDTITFKRLQNYLIGSVNNENKGRIWLGTSEGVYCFQDKYHKNYFKEYKTLIRSVYLNTDSLIFNGTNIKKSHKGFFVNDFSLNFDNRINLNTTIPYKIKSITFNYSAICFDDNSKNQYSHILLGYEKDWSSWSNESRKEYTNLQEGMYIFKVKAKNIYNIESTIAEFQFYVLAPWYNTIWAYLIYIILLTFFIILIVKLYTIRLRKEKEKLEKLVIERTSEILTQKEEISEQAQQLYKINMELLKLSKVASETDNAIVIFDKNGNIEWVNNGFTRMYGYTYEQFISEKNINIIGSSENENIDQVIKTCIKEKKSVVYEFKTRTRDGKVLWAQTTLTNVIDKNNDTINLIAIETDITKLKTAEEEIIKQKKKIEKQRDLLEISNATITKFFKIIAHDLRNPISTLVNSTGIILHDIKNYDKEKTTLFISELNKLSQTTYILLENLLDWSSNQMGEIPFSPKEIDLNIIIKENLDLISTKIQSKSIHVNIDLPKTLIAYADENMVKAVIRNILSNASKYTSNNGNINIFVNEDNNFVKINIQDTGVGMSEADLSKLFRTDTIHSTPGTSNEKGSGLGLILCKEFIEKNGGTLTVESKIRQGSTFSFTLKKA